MSEEANPQEVRAFYETLYRWIIGNYARRMHKVLERGEASPARYEEEFKHCCKEAFERFRLKECGYNGPTDLVAEAGPARERFFDEYRRIKYLSGEGSADVADFLRWEEKTTHRQKTSTEDKQTMWNASLELHKDAIPESAEYKRRIAGLAVRLRQKGVIPWRSTTMNCTQRYGASSTRA